MKPSLAVILTATGYTLNGQFDATVYTDASLETELTTELASADTVYIKFEHPCNSVAIPNLPVGVSAIEFLIEDDNPNGMLTDLLGGQSLEWDASFNVLKITTTEGLGSSKMSVWGML